MSSNGPTGPYDPNAPQQPQQGGYPPQQGGYPPQQGGYYPPQGPPQGYYQAPPSGDSGGRGLGKILATVVVLALIGAAVYLVPKFLDKNDAAAAADTSGEVFLEPAAAQGQNPFSSEPLAEQPQNVTATGGPLPTGTTASAVQASTGGTVGLYGGTVTENACDPQKQILFFQNNPDKAAAWVAAFNTDPSLQWQGGTLTVADIPAFIQSLTSVVLQADTRVTNHGYRNGKAYAFQSILQKGTSALVDQYGVFRVRCYCGNPLTSPVALTTKPKYQGTTWQGFDPSKVKVVTAASQPVKQIPIVDANGNLLGYKPAGTATAPSSPSTPTSSSAPGTPSTPTGQATTVTSQGVPYSYAKPAGLKVQTATSGLANGATKFVFSANLAGYNAHDKNNPVAGFEIVDLTTSVSNKAYLKAFEAADVAFGKQYPGAWKGCSVINQPLTLGGFSGTVSQYGPCGSRKVNGVVISPRTFGAVSFAGTRPDGTRVAVVGTLLGGQSLSSFAESTVASFKRG